MTEDDFAIVAYESLDPDRFPESGVPHYKFTESLGATHMRVNVVELEPGQAVGEHNHEDHEEIYVSLTGGQVRIAGQIHEVPEGGVVRVGPEPLRHVFTSSPP